MMKTRDFLGNEWEIDCMGCAVSEGSMSVPGGLILRTQWFCVHQDPLIPLSGFLVIASMRHVQSISEMGDAEYQEFSKIIRVSHAAIKTVTRVNYLTLVQEESSKHFHLWFFPWTTEVVEQYGSPYLSKVREIMADFKGRTLGKTEWNELEKSIEAIKARMMKS